MKIAALVLLAALAAPQEVVWKKDFKETLKEAATSKKLVLLVFQTKDRKNCLRFQNETLADPGVAAALGKYLCVRIDPEGTDDDNRLWQEQGSITPPITIVFEPDGRKLVVVSQLNPKYYGGQLRDIVPTYFEQIVPAREAIAKDPNQPAPHATLGEAYIVLDNSKDSAHHYGLATDQLLSKGDKAGALKVLTSQLKQYYECKWYRPSRACSAKIAELDPENATKQRPLAAWMIGMADVQERKFDDAITGLKEAVEKYKACDIIEKMMFTLGAAYKEKGDKQNALVLWDSIVIKFPDTETAKIAETMAAKLREQIQKENEGK